jgi:hypothetical protein
VFETHLCYMWTSCLYSISNMLSVTIHISNLSLTKTLRICLYTRVLPESRFALQCFLTSKTSYHAYILLCIHNLSFRILRFISLTYVTYLDDYTNLLTLSSSSKTSLTWHEETKSITSIHLTIYLPVLRITYSWNLLLNPFCTYTWTL